MSNENAPKPFTDAAGVTWAAQYIGTSASRAGETNLRWQRVGLFTTLHIAGLGSLPFIWKTELPLMARISIIGVISFFALLMGIVALLVTRRAHEWIELWNKGLTQLELGPPLSPVEIYRSELFSRIHGRVLSFHHVLLAICWTFIGLWCLILTAAVNADITMLARGL